METFAFIFSIVGIIILYSIRVNKFHKEIISLENEKSDLKFNLERAQFRANEATEACEHNFKAATKEKAFSTGILLGMIAVMIIAAATLIRKWWKSRSQK